MKQTRRHGVNLQSPADYLLNHLENKEDNNFSENILGSVTEGSENGMILFEQLSHRFVIILLQFSIISSGRAPSSIYHRRRSYARRKRGGIRPWWWGCWWPAFLWPVPRFFSGQVRKEISDTTNEGTYCYFCFCFSSLDCSLDYSYEDDENSLDAYFHDFVNDTDADIQKVILTR